MIVRHVACLVQSCLKLGYTCLCMNKNNLLLQHLLDPALPEDIEDGLDEDTVTFSIGEALDHIGDGSLLPVGARLGKELKFVCPAEARVLIAQALAGSM